MSGVGPWTSLIAAILLAGAATGACAEEPAGDLLPRLERLAAQGDAEALYHLGMSYQTGSGVAADHPRALDYFRRAAALGNPLASYKVGCFHAGQYGVLPVDEDRALAEKLVAARAGYALAQQDVAAIYARRGEARAAAEWLARAAAQGTRDALFGYATLHNGRNGRPRDAALVVAYFTLFLSRGDGDPAQRSWLETERAKLTDAERTRADEIVAGYHPAPTALTLEALSGQRAARARRSHAVKDAPRVIRVVTVVARDARERLLLVRKRGTRVFMQPGGKIEPGESAREALARELAEEVSLTVDPARLRPLGTFRAAAANEAGHIVEAEMFALDGADGARAAAEIEELWWRADDDASDRAIAPLTRRYVLRLDP